MKTRAEPDGTTTVTMSDGRRFSLIEDDDGTLVVQAVESDMILRPLSSTAIEIDTPFQ